MHWRSLVFAAAGIVLWAGGMGERALAQSPCPDGLFVATGTAFVPRDAAADSGEIDLANSQVAMGSACAPVPAHLHATRRATIVTAKWPTCTGVRGRVKLKARIDSTCTTMTGTVKGRHFKRSFVAHRQVASLCGNGVVDIGETCDTTATPSGCPTGQGCIETNGACGCAPVCESTQPSPQAIASAATQASDQVPDAWGNPQQFQQALRLIEAQLGCSLVGPAGPPAAAPALQPDVFPMCEESYHPNVNYCGPGNGCVTSGLPHVGDCLNQACFHHDQCYDLNCVDVAHNCFFTPQSANAGCDAPLTAACSTCSSSVLSADFYREQAVCDIAARTAARTPRPECLTAPCPGSSCPGDGSGICATTTTTPGATSTSTSVTPTTVPSSTMPPSTTSSTVTGSTTTTTMAGGNCCVTTGGCPGETGSSCPATCCCCPLGEACSAQTMACVSAP